MTDATTIRGARVFDGTDPLGEATVRVADGVVTDVVTVADDRGDLARPATRSSTRAARRCCPAWSTRTCTCCPARWSRRSSSV